MVEKTNYNLAGMLDYLENCCFWPVGKKRRLVGKKRRLVG